MITKNEIKEMNDEAKEICLSYLIRYFKMTYKFDIFHVLKVELQF